MARCLMISKRLATPHIQKARLHLHVAIHPVVSNVRKCPIKEKTMTSTDENAPKVHYICQTYAEKKGAAQGSLEIVKQFEYSSASQAQERAERESRSDECVGADAYMVTEDPNSGEVGSPTFLVRLGNVPEFDEF
jgi:hypothetical protein